MKSLLAFDPEALLQALSKLTQRKRALFSALCAARQTPVYEAFHVLTGIGDPPLLASVQDWVWSTLSMPTVDTARGAAQLDMLKEKLLLDTEMDVETEWLEYAADAVGSVHGTVQALMDDTPNAASWAARAGYRIVDAYVLGQLSARLPSEGGIITQGLEREVLASELVQAELRNQAQDLADAKAWREGDRHALEALRSARAAVQMIPLPSRHGSQG